jgi:hypothetical protein
MYGIYDNRILPITVSKKMKRIERLKKSLKRIQDISPLPPATKKYKTI